MAVMMTPYVVIELARAGTASKGSSGTAQRMGRTVRRDMRVVLSCQNRGGRPRRGGQGGPAAREATNRYRPYADDRFCQPELWPEVNRAGGESVRAGSL